MQNVSSPHVWALLPCSERTAVAEAIVRVLTEEVENERFRENPSILCAARGNSVSSSP
jgi:hypothetical protein